MRSLQDLQEAWLQYAPDNPIAYAAPLLTYVPANFTKQSRRVLYVGKATAGDFNRDSFRAAKDGPLIERIAERRRTARDVFENTNRSNPASFWGFCSDVSLALDRDCSNVENLVWTNVCKVGLVRGNPGKAESDAQSSLAIETLRREIAELKPSIVVAVSAHCGESILRAAVGDDHDGDWIKSEDEGDRTVGDVWWMPLSKGQPPVLWMRHPERSNSELRTYALNKIRELVG